MTFVNISSSKIAYFNYRNTLLRFICHQGIHQGLPPYDHFYLLHQFLSFKLYHYYRLKKTDHCKSCRNFQTDHFSLVYLLIIKLAHQDYYQINKYHFLWFRNLVLSRMAAALLFLKVLNLSVSCGWAAAYHAKLWCQPAFLSLNSNLLKSEFVLKLFLSFD